MSTGPPSEDRAPRKVRSKYGRDPSPSKGALRDRHATEEGRSARITHRHCAPDTLPAVPGRQDSPSRTTAPARRIPPRLRHRGRPPVSLSHDRRSQQRAIPREDWRLARTRLCVRTALGRLVFIRHPGLPSRVAGQGSQGSHREGIDGRVLDLRRE